VTEIYVERTVKIQPKLKYVTQKNRPVKQTSKIVAVVAAAAVVVVVANLLGVI